MNIRPLNDYIVVRIEEGDRKVGGLHIPIRRKRNP
jgi:co-chaperonin GroES (HSP10)